MGLLPGPPDKVRFLASNQLKDIAEKASHASDESADSSIIAILFAAAWFEASINEVIHDVLDGSMGHEHRSRLDEVRLMVKAAGIDEKFATMERKVRVLCAATTKRELAPAEEPWKSVFLLFQLRNWLVHLRPEILHVREGRDDEPSSLVSTRFHELVLALQSVGAIGDIPSGRIVPVTSAIQLPGVGNWAYRSVSDGLRELRSWLPEGSRRLA